MTGARSLSWPPHSVVRLCAVWSDKQFCLKILGSNISWCDMVGYVRQVLDRNRCSGIAKFTLVAPTKAPETCLPRGATIGINWNLQILVNKIHTLIKCPKQIISGPYCTKTHCFLVYINVVGQILFRYERDFFPMPGLHFSQPRGSDSILLQSSGRHKALKLWSKALSDRRMNKTRTWYTAVMWTHMLTRKQSKRVGGGSGGRRICDELKLLNV